MSGTNVVVGDRPAEHTYWLEYQQVTGPCPRCRLRGYVGDNRLDTCGLCNGGGWWGRWELVFRDHDGEIVKIERGISPTPDSEPSPTGSETE